tara:strand:+ start:656 stop:1108 length:453 start_codon:yes stop_codon:yes gene_type:complete
MSTLIFSSIKPSYHVHRRTNKRRTRVSPIAHSSPIEEQPVQDIIIEYEEKPEPVPEYRFAEVLNGRAAMQGFLWGSMNWVMTGDNIIQQVEDPVYAMAATGVVITLALASVFTAEDFTIDKIGAFTPEAELKNGRLAMLGFTTLLGLSAM